MPPRAFATINGEIRALPDQSESLSFMTRYLATYGLKISSLPHARLRGEAFPTRDRSLPLNVSHMGSKELQTRERMLLFTLFQVHLELQAPPSGSRALLPNPNPSPRDTDPDFRIKIQVQDEIGLRLTLDRLQAERPLNQAIARNVTAANQSLDGKIRGYEVWIQNAYFAAQSTGRMVPSSIPKDPQQGFTVGHPLTILVQKQYKHWKNFMRSATTNGLAELGDLVGPAAGSLKKHSVGWGTVYAVAIRRRKLRDGHWCYSLQLEIRVSEQWRP
ncbi:hypothetical protein ACG7TL_001823 [Trametes sanguinea]